ncbi:MAG: peptide deformylase [Desulfobacterales bacterium]|nr:peptide deformylase [Desulfobacterales bacterium]
MSILEIITYPNNFLRQLTKAVDNITGQTQDLIASMVETMYAAPGVGLAANQVGSEQRILVFDASNRDETRSPTILINPKIIERHGEIISEDEGCLSVPDFRSNVRRAESILVECVDRDGNPLSIEASGFLAIILQHEIDHLEGKLFIDHISKLKRQLFTRRMKKRLKDR